MFVLRKLVCCVANLIFAKLMLTNLLISNVLSLKSIVIRSMVCCGEMACAVWVWESYSMMSPAPLKIVDTNKRWHCSQGAREVREWSQATSSHCLLLTHLCLSTCWCHSTCWCCTGGVCSRSPGSVLRWDTGSALAQIYNVVHRDVVYKWYIWWSSVMLSFVVCSILSKPVWFLAYVPVQQLCG